MAVQNSERALARILRELAAEHGFTVDSLGQGWILRIQGKGLTGEPLVRHVYGYGFDLNPAATHLIANDKAATSDLLTAAGVPCVPHALFLHPDLAQFVPHQGNWPGMLATLQSHAHDSVVKDNTGTGGRGVYRVRNPLELELATSKLFSQGTSVAMCPFFDIQREVRFVMLDGRCLAAYEKLRPSVVGDGTRTALELLAERVSNAGVTSDLARWLASLDAESAALLRQIPPKNSTLLLNWRHNLGQGATVRLLSIDDAQTVPMTELAIRAARVLNLSFGSVDVIQAGNDRRVLEVNSGVMMEFMSTSVPGGAQIAKSVYRQAFRRMFDLPAQ
jgi:glutathione synthase/RimK-type ligase-like ATP-grasp enzyme